MSIKIVSRSKSYPFEINYVTSYKINIETSKTSLAKTYETKNELIVTLKVAKTQYRNPEIQTLLKWAEWNAYKEEYYRDFGMNVHIMDTFEQSIVFTHAYIVTNIYADTEADFVTIKVIVNQKRDKFVGVVFGETLDETYAAAWERVTNPPRPMYVPSFVTENAEYVKAANSIGNNYKLLKKKDTFCMLDFIQNRRKLTFKRENKKPQIYCNFPEHLEQEQFTNNYLLLNRVELSKDDNALLYLSYQRKTAKKCKFVVRVYNPNAEELEVTIGKVGQITSNSWSLAVDVWKQYCNDDKTKPKIKIPYDHTKCILEGDFSKELLEVLARIKVNRKAIIGVYLVQEGSSISNYSNAKPYSVGEDNLTYSGIAPTWSLSTAVTLEVSNLLNNYTVTIPKEPVLEEYKEKWKKIEENKANKKNEEEILKEAKKDYNYAKTQKAHLENKKFQSSISNSVFYKLCEPKETGVCNEGEDIPIYLVQGGYEKNNTYIAKLGQKGLTADVNNTDGFSNVGNFAVEYHFTFTLFNKSEEPIKIGGYIISNQASHCAGIRMGTQADGVYLAQEGKLNKDNRWKFFECIVDKKEGIKKIEFTYMHLSKGNAPCLLQLEASKI